MSGFKKVGGWGGEERKSGICSRQTCGPAASPEALVGGKPRDVNAGRVFCPNVLLCWHYVLPLCAVRQELYSLSLFCPRLPLTSRPIYIRLQKNIHIHGSKIYIHPAHYHNGHALKSRGEFHQYVWADTQVETSGSSSVLTKKVSLSKNGR